MEERFLVHLDPGSFEFPSNCDCHLRFYALLFENGEEEEEDGKLYFLPHVVRTWIGFSPAGGGTCMYTTRNVSDGFMKWS